MYNLYNTIAFQRSEEICNLYVSTEVSIILLYRYPYKDITETVTEIDISPFV